MAFSKKAPPTTRKSTSYTLVPQHCNHQCRSASGGLLLGLCLVQLLLLGGVTRAGAVPLISDDVMALLVFKAGLSDPTSALSSWNDNDSTPCKWNGVLCSTSSGRVTQLNLVGLSLSGTIGRALVKLDQLESLNLAYNNLSGIIIGELAQIPKLGSVNVSNNALSGSIPPAFGNAGNLYALDLSNNALSGIVPPEIFSNDCQSLRYISVANNQLEGPIPLSVGSCLELQELNFSSNSLSGEIPNGIWALEGLQAMDLSFNTLSGQIPVGVGFLMNLTSLRLQGNGFSGQVPSELGNCVLLQELNLNSNHFTGELPLQLGNLRSLSVLDLGRNYLSGSIPSWLFNILELKELNLAGNQFGGPIPSSVQSLRQLETIDFSYNSFTGDIPMELGTMQSLQVIRLSNNVFTGEVPDYSSGGGCQGLEWLDLSSNRLSGVVPANLSSCSKLYYLSLSGNMLQSDVPMEFGSMPSLVVLDLSDNNLIGTVPASLGNAPQARVLRLNGNSLNGSLPGELGNATSLVDLNVAQNNLTGPIPNDLGRLVNLEYLDLSFNFFTGQIPDDLGQLQNLQTINLSHNQLQGPIPTGGVFNRTNTTAFEQNTGLCGSAVNLSCSTFPNPLIINPNDPNSQPGGLSPLFQSKRSQTILSVSAITSISAAAAIALGVIMVTLLNMYAQTRRRSNIFTIDSDPQSPNTAEMAMGKLVMFTRKSDPKSDDWMTSTHAIFNKDCEIGRGGFGTVFKAVLAHGETVAVKKLMVGSLVKTREDFEKVVHMLGSVRHPNLVSLQGYYWTEQLQLLVYDFLPNGNLYSQLHERREDEPQLSWRVRFKIALGTAHGLAHLHHGCTPQLIHYDVKSSNVLLDEEFEARLSDYSLAKLLPKLDSYVMSSKMQSALGYMAPEFACQSLKITEKCDVYGFGVLLLELVTGRRPVEYMEDDVVILCDFVRALLDEGRALTCVDPKLHLFPEDEVLPIIKLGLICTSQVPSNRPSMAEVVQILELIRPLVESRES
ncbi:unnamed protein product [Calypogeia fissa]